MQLMGSIRAMFHRDASATGSLAHPAGLLALTDSNGGREAASPFVTEFVMVECSHYIGLAYQDAERNWRTAYTDTKLPKPVKILE